MSPSEDKLLMVFGIFKCIISYALNVLQLRLIFLLIEQRRRNEAQDLKTEGNEVFKDEKYDEARAKYTQALLTCPLCFAKERSIMYSNRGACKYRQVSAYYYTQRQNKLSQIAKFVKRYQYKVNKMYQNLNFSRIFHNF